MYRTTRLNNRCTTLYQMVLVSADTMQLSRLKKLHEKEEIMTNQKKTIEAASVQTRRNKVKERYKEWQRDKVGSHSHKAGQQSSTQPYLYIGNNTITYEQMWQDALLYAKSFKQLGVKRRDHIAVLMNNQASYPALMIAASIVGAVFIPINSMLSKKELA